MENIENKSGLDLTAVILTTVQVIKLQLLHSKIDMIYFAKPGLTQDLYIVQK
jgi:hypothetical protein